MSVLIWRGDRPSGGAAALKNALRLNGLRAFLNRRSGRYTPSRRRKLVVNWGRSDCPRLGKGWVLNDPACVNNAADKLVAFTKMREAGVPVPEFTSDPEVAADWLASGKFRRVLARTTLRGSQGHGILMLDQTTQTMPRAPLFVEYVPKKHEYRIHVGRGEVLDIQQKRKRREVDNDDVNYQVRNGRHGWVFCRHDVTPPPGAALGAAVAAVDALGLDFGAVDMGVTEKDGRVAVYEVNTAPGLEGTTLETYAQFITNLTSC